MKPLPIATLSELFPGIERETITIHDYAFKTGDTPLEELEELCRLVKWSKPKTIFEIGTFEGCTTLHLAANSDADVYTIDLPTESQRIVWDSEIDVYPDQPGNRFQGTPYAERIHLLFGDSSKFDYSSWLGKVDLVFVDGCHHYEFVSKDSQNALRLISPSGLIVWHDYASYAPGVVRTLEELADSFPMVHIAKTSMAVYCACEQFKSARQGIEWISKRVYDELLARHAQLESCHEELHARHVPFTYLSGILAEVPRVAFRAIKRRLPGKQKEA